MDEERGRNKDEHNTESDMETGTDIAVKIPRTQRATSAAEKEKRKPAQ